LKPLFFYLFSWIRQKKILKHVIPCKKLLDVGCGEEYYLLKSLRKKVDLLYGVDSDVESKNDENIYITREYLVDKLPYSPNKFNIVIMAAVLEHLEYPIEILREVYRVLTKNGELILTTPDPNADKLLKIFRMLKLSELDEENHKYYFSISDLHKIPSEIGYKDIRIYPFEFGLNKLVIAKKGFSRRQCKVLCEVAWKISAQSEKDE